MLTHWYEASTDDGRFEIVNNQRTFEYAKALNIRGVKTPGCSCASVYACDSGPYTLDLLQGSSASEDELDAMFGCMRRVIPVSADSPGAPWWDSAIDASYSFAGFYCRGVSGWDSTFTREQFSRSLTGTAFGVRRRDGRSLTFDGVLIASTAAGLEYGLSYYDALLAETGSCGLFALYTATRCPRPGDTEDDARKYIRHLRGVTLGEGPKVLETRVTSCCGGECMHKTGGAHYARIQFTLLSEMPWIFTEPEFVLQNQLFLPEDTEWNIKFINSSDARPPAGHWREVLTSRQRYPIEIGRDGSICRVGGWEWSETQLGGGDGIVVIASAKEAPAVQLQEIEQEEEEEKKECPQCQVILNWDVNSGARTFETLRWSNNIRWNSDGTFPCDCEITIAGVRIRNEDFDPNPEEGGEPPNTVKNAQFEYVSVSNSGEDGDCCFVELYFTSPTTGHWVEAPGKGGHRWSVNGRDPMTHEQLFPPRGCALKVQNNCPELEKPEQGVLYTGPDNLKYIGVRGPVIYSENGRWDSAPNSIGGAGPEKRHWGCLPNTPCARQGLGAVWVPYVVNSDEISGCVRETQRKIRINTALDLWEPVDWFNDKISAFPPEGVEFEIENPQKSDKVVLTEWVETDPGGCVSPGCGSRTSSPKQVFPSFSSDCWEPIYIPQADPDQIDTGCFCLPVEAISKCGKITNTSSVYKMAGSLSLRTGNQELRNFQIKGWIHPFEDLPLPCEDPDYWTDKPVDFTLRVPHLPSGCVLRIDSETRKGTLSFPGGASEPAIRYVTGDCDEPFNYMYLDPCTTMYFIVEADAHHTASNMGVDIFFNNFYGASGSLLPSS